MPGNTHPAVWRRASQVAFPALAAAWSIWYGLSVLSSDRSRETDVLLIVPGVGVVLALAVALIVRALLPARPEPAVDGTAGRDQDRGAPPADDEDAPVEESPPTHPGTPVLLVTATATYVVLVGLLGFWIPSVVFAVAVAWTLSPTRRERPGRALAVTGVAMAAMLVVTYLLFVVLLDVELP
jgi:hypothetical protein